MADLPTLEEALKLADQDSPLPSLAGPALKVLRNKIRELTLLRRCAERFAREEDAEPLSDSATLASLIVELRAREAVGRAKYGTDVDRGDLTHAQWRQHLREELMDALLYSLAEQRTDAPLSEIGPVLMWMSMDTAPRDGSAIIARMQSALNLPERLKYQDGWVFTVNYDREHKLWKSTDGFINSFLKDEYFSGWLQQLSSIKDC